MSLKQTTPRHSQHRLKIWSSSEKDVSRRLGRDDFQAAGPVRRSVYAPPYSLRPPDTEPEVWLSLNQKSTDELREKWKLRDPEGFATQELRRKNYFEMKKKGKVPKVSLALPVLQCKMFFDSKSELFYDDPYDTDDFAVGFFFK